MARGRTASGESFEEIVAKLDGFEIETTLGIEGTIACPAPRWDPLRSYRVALVNEVPTIQRFLGGDWIAAPVEPPGDSEAPETAVEKQRTTETRLFVSHASEDAGLAKQLAALVDGALAVPARAMRCTSVPGYKLEPGADGPEELRENLRDASVVIGLLTPSSISSPFVLMELGAAWGLKTCTVPLLADGVPFGSIPGPIGQGTHAIRVSDPSGLASLLETIEKRCGMPWRTDAARRHDLVSGFVASVSGRKT
jgi:hypothetical protein